jgi:hypothetical protein
MSRTVLFARPVWWSETSMSDPLRVNPDISLGRQWPGDQVYPTTKYTLAQDTSNAEGERLKLVKE